MRSTAARSTAAERRLRAVLRGSLETWVRFALQPQGFAPAAHHLHMLGHLQDVAEGRCDRLMLLMPPGHAKSTYASLLFPAWFMARHRGAPVVAVSHTAGLAEEFGRGVRGLVAQHGARLGIRLAGDNRAAGRFGVSGGGSYFATGVRGPVTGRRADLLIIDDPVKSQLEADSAEIRAHTWDWYCSDLITRLRPGGRVVLVMTRWHPDDLGGRLLEASDGWRVVRLPALAEEGDPLGRQPGEALWPEWEDAAALERKRAAMGERAFQALFQQRPRVPEGGLFQVGRMPIVDAAMPGQAVRAWDLGASPTGDWTAGVKLVRGEGGWQVQDVQRFKAGPEDVVQAILRTAEADGRGVEVGFPQDPGQAGRSQVVFLTHALSGWRVRSSPETGAKSVRAMPVASQANGGTVSLLCGAWNRDFLGELRDFPGGKWDDQVDALSRGFQMLLDAPAPARMTRLAWGGR